MADPERAPLVRLAFEVYATGRYTKQQVLEQARAWGLTNRRNRPLTSQAIGSLLRNHLYAHYAGIVHVPEYGVRVKRGDFEPLISEDLFYRVQSVLSGRVPITTPQQRAHPDFPLRAFVRCESCGCPHAIVRTVSSSSEMTHCERHTRTRLQIALKRYRTALIGELHDDIDDPWPGQRPCVGTFRNCVR